MQASKSLRTTAALNRSKVCETSVIFGSMFDLCSELFLLGLCRRILFFLYKKTEEENWTIFLGVHIRGLKAQRRSSWAFVLG